MPSSNKHGRVPEQVIEYNRVLQAVAAKRQIPVIDLYNVLLPVRAAAQVKVADVHFKPLANRLLGLEVARGIAAAHNQLSLATDLAAQRDACQQQVAALVPVE